MTWLRSSICAFKNLQAHIRLCQKPHLIRHYTCWTHCRLSVYPNDLIVPPHRFFPAHSSAFLTLPSGNITVCPVRLKSKKSQKKSKQGSIEDEESEKEDSAEDLSDYEDEPEGGTLLQKDYKDIEKAVQSFRYDVILTAGLDISRHKVEDAFYNSLLRLNGEKLWKKSRAVKIGDILDLIIEENKETETTTVMRVILKNVSEEKTASEKYKVLLRRWKNLRIAKEEKKT
ncbi:mitochondrial transcription rescue factor 1 [Bombina bombina]|uniref:mitochondrial transcription rescue factor 1 n=1 Tax=Bombina bombina TaxID=8345 RepID=UPI00235B2DB6|nr:mitochondrial transcription rescue factor 1 [Bombina bombina]